MFRVSSFSHSTQKDDLSNWVGLFKNLNKFPCSIDHNCKEFRKLFVVDVGIVGEGSRVQGVLEVDIAGGGDVRQPL